MRLRNPLIMFSAVQRTLFTLCLALGAAAVRGSAACSDDRERGDVPGWVMITLMSAVLVAALLAIAGPALQGLFESAIEQVSP